MNILKGIKVLDMSKVLAGPHCSMLLGDLGADIIKIETPGVGDDTREMGVKQNGLSGFYVSTNRNKRAITLNLKEEKARQAFYKMIETTDVFMENLLTGGAEKLKVDYDTLKAIKPDIIYVSISGYGRTGPYAKKGGYDLMAQAAGGVISVTGLPNLPEPVRVGYSISDIGTGVLSAMAVLAALMQREQTGKGQKIETNLLSTQINYASYILTQYGITGINPEPTGTKHASMAPYQTFYTKDGRLIIGMSNEAQWKRFCTIPGLEHLATNSDYEGMLNRVKNRDNLADEIEKLIGEMSNKDVVALMDKYGIPNSPINTMADLFEDEFIRNELMIDYEYPEYGHFVAPKFPITFKDSEMPEPKLPPLIGEHNDEVFAEFGFTPEEIQDLKDSGAV